MPGVEFSESNVSKCLCGHCPVQIKSNCAKEKYEKSKQVSGLPSPEDLPGLYCSTGKATCKDLKNVKQCLCPGCLVWAENKLHSNHYCTLGSATQIE